RRESLPHVGLGVVRITFGEHDRMSRACLDRIERRPVVRVVGGVERQLAPAGRSGVAVDGDAGAVRPAVAHLHEHRGEVRAELRLELRVFAEQPDDPTHGVLLWRISTYDTRLPPRRRPELGAGAWSIPT